MDTVLTVRLRDVERVTAQLRDTDTLGADLGEAKLMQGPPGATSYLYAEVEDGELVIYGGEKDDIRFSINDAGELEATYAEV